MGGFESSHHLSGRDDITNDTDANFSSSWGSSLPSAEGEALGIIWKLEPKFEGSLVCHCLFRQEAAVESPDGW